MKKVFAILLVLAIVAGFAFATDGSGKAAIKVETLVTVVEPTYKLTAGSESANVDGSNPVNSDTYTIAQNTLIAEGSTSVTFYVKQRTDCKSYKTYSFSATAENLVMTKQYKADGVTLETYTGGEATPENHRAFKVNATDVNTFVDTNATEALKGLKLNTSTGSSYKIKYTGDLIKGDDTGDTAIVTSFVCTWTNDPAAVPGQYESNITLKVTCD